VRRVLAARVAELGHFQTASGGLLVLGRRVVAVLALGALHGDDFAHCLLLLSWPTTTVGEQLAWSSESRRLTRRDAGLEAPAALVPEVVVLG
jgi:hypothetical protein